MADFSYQFADRHLPLMREQVWESGNDIAVYTGLASFEFPQFAAHIGNPKTVLELGCGLGRGSIYLNHLLNDPVSFVLADRDGLTRNTGAFDPATDEFYNDMALTADFCRLNGLTDFRLFDTETDDWDTLPGFDLIFSLCSFGPCRGWMGGTRTRNCRVSPSTRTIRVARHFHTGNGAWAMRRDATVTRQVCCQRVKSWRLSKPTAVEPEVTSVGGKMDETKLKTWLTANLYGPSKAQAGTLAAKLIKLLTPLVETVPDPHGWRPRITCYEIATKFPGALFVGADGRLVGTWIMGNDYQVKSKYYGGYPNTYLRRVKALFSDKVRPLHLFSGEVDLSIIPGDTVDLTLASALAHPRGGMHYTDDAQTLTRVPLEKYDLVLADPPYSAEDAEHYHTSMVKRNLVFRALSRVKPGTHIVWLDQVLPMWRKDTFRLTGVVGLVRSTNHRFRIMSVYERL